MIVLTRGLPYDSDRVDKQKELLALSHESKQIIALKSGHNIQLEDPALVVAAIREMVDKIKKQGKKIE